MVRVLPHLVLVLLLVLLSGGLIFPFQHTSSSSVNHEEKYQSIQELSLVLTIITRGHKRTCFFFCY